MFKIPVEKCSIFKLKEPLAIRREPYKVPTFKVQAYIISKLPANEYKCLVAPLFYVQTNFL